MRFSTAVTFLAALAEVAFGQNSCGATSADCPTIRSNIASISSCSSYFTQNSIKTSTCYTSTVLTTKYNLTITETKTFYATTSLIATTVVRFTTNLGADTVTYRPTTTDTVTATAYDTATVTGIVTSTITSLSTSTVISTTTVTRTGYPPASSASSTATVVAKLRKRAVTVPGPCSCFLFTSTVRTRAAYEFPTATTTITISTTIVATSTSAVTTSSTLTIRGGVVTATSWVTSSVTITQTVPTTKVLGITTAITQPATTVITSYVTEYTYIPPTTPNNTCTDAVGLEVGLYDNRYRLPEAGSNTTDYPDFNPVWFRTLNPYRTNQTSDIGLVFEGDEIEYANFHPYGMAAKVFTYSNNTKGVEYVLNHRGYFYAPKAETYSFRISSANDGAWVWVGEKARLTWTRENADAKSVREGGMGPADTFNIELAAGSYTPIRIMFANGLKIGNFRFSIKDSTGTTYATTGSQSEYLVSYSCDRPQEVPKFVAFGAEQVGGIGAPDTSCDNVGTEVAIYRNPYGGGGGANYSNFIPESYKYTLQPYGAKIVGAWGVRWGTGTEGTHPFGFNPPQDPLEYTLNWRGYFYVPRSGTYNFRLYSCDNYCAVWTGDKAKAGWARANQDLSAFHRSAGATPVPEAPQETSMKLELIGGTYLPVRVMLGNYAGPGSLWLDIWDSNDYYWFRTSTPTPHLVRFSCDKSVGRFQNPFGEEE
ncbi:hypothetical protein TWF730_009138 [Orbilia blumenaviensis]|uniref:PA14 domain-containing protein n=1 Tax=Orbilia blumenaviensis TaxID=1796055 RepID=A0AAV9UXP2_9PEZI